MSLFLQFDAPHHESLVIKFFGYVSILEVLLALLIQSHKYHAILNLSKQSKLTQFFIYGVNLVSDFISE